MIYTTKGRNEKKGSRLFAVCFFWIVLWQILAMIVGNTLLLPTVFETLQALAALIQEKHFYVDVAWTLFRCILAIVISLVSGILLALVSYKNYLVRSIMVLPVSFFKAVPVMAIVIYVILLAKADWVAVVACFLMCFPIAYTNTLSGLDSVSKDLLEVGEVYRFSEHRIRRHIFFPSILPNINAAMKVIAGLSWKAVVAAEVLSVPEFSLGQGMISAKYYLETPTLFAYIAVIVALSLCLENAIMILTEKISAKGYEGSKLKKTELSTTKAACTIEAPKVKLVEVSKSFGQKKVLSKITEEINAGEKMSIIGPSGSGKTTLARIVAGLEKEDSGSIDFTKEVEVSYLFQEDRLFPWLNVYDNMALGMDKIDKESIVDMAKKLEIEEVLYKMPDELSGGMRHRVALGRTFLAESNLIILDEPFRGLDEELKKRIVDRLWEETTVGKTVIVISHSQGDIEMLGIGESIFVE